MQGTEAFIVKVCGITSVEDARAAVEAGANALGFNFYSGSPRCITPSEACAISAETPGNYLRVGVFVNASEHDLRTTAESANLDVLQLHGEVCAIPKTAEYRIWRAVPGENAVAASAEWGDRIEAYLLDSMTPHYGGSGRTFRWECAKGFGKRTIVAGGLDESNVAAAIRALDPWGVDACSRLESSPGRKHLVRMRAFVRAAFEEKMVSK